MESINWEEKYLAQNTPWDKGEPAPPLVEYLQTHTLEGEILVPGCGVGHDVRLLATQNAQITGLDIAPTAIDKANRIKNPSNTHFEIGNFFELPAHWQNHFDCIFEHTCFCAIHPKQRSHYVAAAHQALKPSGHLLAIFFTIVDNADPEHPPFPISPPEIDRLFDPHFETIDKWTPQTAYPSREGGKEQMRWMRKREARRQ